MGGCGDVIGRGVGVGETVTCEVGEGGDVTNCEVGEEVEEVAVMVVSWEKVTAIG